MAQHPAAKSRMKNSSAGIVRNGRAANLPAGQPSKVVANLLVAAARLRVARANRAADHACALSAANIKDGR
jgi:hypothetical protein